MLNYHAVMSVVDDGTQVGKHIIFKLSERNISTLTAQGSTLDVRI